MINKYVSKPVEITAVQYTGDNVQEILDFCNEIVIDDEQLYIKTLEGKMLCSVNDYIIRGTIGEFYPCTPDVFEFKYNKVIKITE